jgi:hypothetical protein
VAAPPARQAGDEITSGVLYRRIPNDHAHWVHEERRPTVYNFVPAKAHDHLSMQLGDIWSPDEILAAYPGFGLLEIGVHAFGARGLRVTYKPDEGEGHVAIWGLKNAKKALLRELCTQIVRAWEPGTQALVYHGSTKAG